MSSATPFIASDLIFISCSSLENGVVRTAVSYVHCPGLDTTTRRITARTRHHHQEVPISVICLSSPHGVICSISCHQKRLPLAFPFDAWCGELASCQRMAGPLAVLARQAVHSHITLWVMRGDVEPKSCRRLRILSSPTRCDVKSDAR